MKRALILFAFVPALLLAETVIHTLNTSPGAVRFSSLNGFDVVELPQGALSPDPGKPSLPEVAVTLAIPANAQVTGVSVTPLAVTELGVYNVVPAQPPYPLSKQAAAWVPPDAQVYASNTPFPAGILLGYHSGSAAGFRVVAVRVSPFSLRPRSGLLSLHTQLMVKVDYVEGADRTTLTPSQHDRALAGLRSLVQNPEDLERFSPLAAKAGLPEINYLIITNDALAPEFVPFADYRSSRGLRAEIRTKEWIGRNYEGRDLQEKTRNCIRNFFEHRGLSYVLLAGDNAQVPSRRIRVSVGDETGDIPTDLYFGDLDYSWDSNDNDLFGEMSDSVDFYADVITGRAPVDRASQVRNFIAKVKTYEGNPATDYIKRNLLPSGWLWYNIGYHGKFVNDSIANLTPSGWTDVKLENPPGAGVVRDSFDNGFALFDPAGHGNEGGVYDENGTPIYLSSSASQQRNRRRYSIMTSLACTPGNFEAEDCLAEIALNCDSAGCIAVMMNSRYGWGTPPSMGPSEKLCIRFYDHLFHSQEYVIGTAHSRSREEYAGPAQNNSLWRWCMTEFNLLGDPAIDIWTEAPGQLAVSAADTISTGGQNLSVTVTPGFAGARVCAWKGGEVFATGQTDGSGQVSLAIHPVTVGTLKLTATGHNQLAGTRDVVVKAGVPEPYVTYRRSRIDDANQSNPNGILEPGETANLVLTVANTGSGDADDASVVLQITGGRGSVLDSTADYGNIAAGDSATTPSLSIAAAPDAEPGSGLRFLARVAGGGSNWDFEFEVVLGYPGRTCADIDTGQVALTITARGTAGYDREGGCRGRGFRFPQNDTSSLRAASFCLVGCPEYVADRFYNLDSGYDSDWRLVDSVRSRAPMWNADEYMTSAFNDAGHSNAHNVTVQQHALGVDDPGNNDWVIMVYDVHNGGGEAVTAHAGILADFDVVATDRLHDVAFTDAGQATAFMRNVLSRNRWCGVKLLTHEAAARLACIDHGRYVDSDSGLSNDMKYRIMTGSLGTQGSDRPYNWSIAVSTGPLGLPQGGDRRVALAFVAAGDSATYLDACQRAQDWYDANVGVAEPDPKPQASSYRLEAYPNPATNAVNIRFSTPLSGPSSLRVYDAQGRLVHSTFEQRPSPFRLDLRSMPAGVYYLRMTSGDQTLSRRVAIVR
ncbi:T9SS type A sorting domain-containing protein [candidate division WOR-3 bacterium]|uniref:T9SS type A sorting domain-containing protein n=1 Tax=candidate division WOR-3 bacterium TaxID=2052148 RepID=A0A938BSU9_UNCW3|nr:T9SS type A sorting domain-containing protein [candidate division WOR-3 bacterium]